MKENELSESDIKELKLLGISPEAVREQIRTFRRGFKYARLVRPATVGDGVLKLSREESARLSLRTQQIIAEETSISKVADPLAGSYYIEWLTARMEKEIEKEMASIEKKGGMLVLIENGEIQKGIAAQALARQRKIDSGEACVVGVNKYVTEQKPRQLQLQPHDPELVRRQIEKLTELKKQRDSSKLKQSLDGIREAVANNENTMPSIIRAVKEYATCAEIIGVLRDIYGEYQDTD